MNGSEIMAALLIPEITSLVDQYNGTPAIFFDNIIPQTMGVNAKTINFYLSSPTGDTSELPVYQYVMNCRAGTMQEAVNIANAVVTNTNRRHYSGYALYTTFLPTVGPLDINDNYNAPLSITSTNS